MKKLITLAAALLMTSFSAFSQENIKDTKAPKDEIYHYVEQMPEPGFDLSEYLSRTIQYPADARKLKKEGRVIIKFIVDKTGNIDSVRVEKSVYPSLDSAAVSVVKKMPRWKPGMTEGKPVPVYYMVPIKFTLK